MLGLATSPISSNNTSVVVPGLQVVIMITSCCSQLEEVNGVVILRHLPNIFIVELSSSLFRFLFHLLEWT